VTPAHYNPTDDELLAIRCQLGDPAAFDELIQRWHAPLWTFVRHMVGDDEFGIARRTVMDSLRQEYARAATIEVDLDAIASGSPPIDETWKLEELERALDQLPIVEKEVLTLFYLQELSLGDISEALQVPVGTVKSRLFRARRLVREAIAARGPRS
jgi:RNA polymerase sigma-70 factor (ECF subfamily)